jgi:NTP pyrophosphatase (non-canonical NTP hydrolase)
MNTKQYQQEVKRTLNYNVSANEIISMLCMGIAGEVGELIGQLKKNIYHNHPVDRNNIILEIGDLMWYIANLCNRFNINLEKVFDKNIEKLMLRYPDGFNSDRSRNRNK